jgi:nucleotide-binding universal stress UspA family protein
MFSKILVALDRSDMHRSIFNEALAIAKANNSDLMLLHVLSPEEEGSPGLPIYSGPTVYPIPDEAYLETYRQQWEEYENRGLAFLQSLVEEAAEAGISAEFTQSMGNAGRKICQLARTWGADLILVGRRGRSGLSELFLGSVSNYVMHHSSCSVLVVQRRDVKSKGNGSKTQKTTEEAPSTR